MNTKNVTKENKKNSTLDSKTLRVSTALFVQIESELKKINQIKEGSKKVKVSDLFTRLLEKVSDEDRIQLARSTVTNFDLFELGYRKFKKENRKASKDDFMGQIATGRIILNSYVFPDSDAVSAS